MSVNSVLVKILIFVKIKHLHDWKQTPSEAIALQKALADQIRIEPVRREIRTVAGLDCAFSRDKKRIGAAIVVLTLPKLEIIEQVHAIEPVTFPYVPGLLSFRECPVCLKATGKLKSRPDVFLVDGQGMAHPRRLGLACHLGLFLDTLTIGCAKSRLTGKYEMPGIEKGSSSDLTDGDEVIGAALRTRTNVKPLFISTGNRCTLNDAIHITLQCCTKYRLPEPTRLAHQQVTELKTSI